MTVTGDSSTNSPTGVKQVPLAVSFMDTYFGGIFLVDSKPVKFFGREHVCLSPIPDYTYPHQDFLFGFDRKHNRNYYYTTDNKSVLEWLSHKEEGGNFGFQGVFNDLDTAQEFHDRFISEEANVLTISIHLPVTEYVELSEWTEQELKAQNPKRKNDVYQNLKKMVNYSDGQEVGYDLLETYYGVIYNMLYETEDNFKSIMEVSQLNRNGLLPTYEAALKAKDFSEDRNVWQIRLH